MSWGELGIDASFQATGEIRCGLLGLFTRLDNPTRMLALYARKMCVLGVRNRQFVLHFPLL